MSLLWLRRSKKALQLVGFPRSANTYLAQWCQYSGLHLVATHDHWNYPRQAGLHAMGVSTYVLVRNPAEAVASCMVRNAMHGSTLQDELNNTEGHFDLWREFHRHAECELVSRGACVITFESIVDHSAALRLKADGFRLSARWSKERFEEYQRIHLEQIGDPAAQRGFWLGGHAKPQLEVPDDVWATYEHLKTLAERSLAEVQDAAVPRMQSIGEFISGQLRPHAWPRRESCSARRGSYGLRKKKARSLLK